jgi:hypothetical protein
MGGVGQSWLVFVGYDYIRRIYLLRTNNHLLGSRLICLYV